MPGAHLLAAWGAGAVFAACSLGLPDVVDQGTGGQPADGSLSDAAGLGGREAAGQPLDGAGSAETGAGEAGSAGDDACVPETPEQICSRLDRECGSTDAINNCGASKSIDCGSCPNNNPCAFTVCNAGRCDTTNKQNGTDCSRGPCVTATCNAGNCDTSDKQDGTPCGSSGNQYCKAGDCASPTAICYVSGTMWCYGEGPSGNQTCCSGTCQCDSATEMSYSLQCVKNWTCAKCFHIDASDTHVCL